MSMKKMVDIEEAQNFIRSKYENFRDFPFLVGVYGSSNHGKSYFVRQFMSRNFDKEKLYAIRSVNSRKECTKLENLDEMKILFLQDPEILNRPSLVLDNFILKGGLVSK